MLICDWSSYLCSSDLLAGVFASFLLLKSTRNRRQEQWIENALIQAGPIILITAAGGAFGAVLKATPLNLLFESWISGQDVSGIWLLPLVFLLAAGLKTSQGSSTAAIIVSASLIARSEEHTSELQSLMRISYAVFCLKKKT